MVFYARGRKGCDGVHLTWAVWKWDELSAVGGNEAEGVRLKTQASRLKAETLGWSNGEVRTIVLVASRL
jgi:hypothetical protein